MHSPNFPTGPSAVGLQNLGNTCYANTALQCLLHTHGLTSFLVREQYEPFITNRARCVDPYRPETLQQGARHDLRTHPMCGTPSLRLVELCRDLFTNLHRRHLVLHREAAGDSVRSAGATQKAPAAPVVPKALLHAVGLVSAYRVRQGESTSAFLIGQQHDLAEFLQFMLDVLHDTAQLEMTFQISGTASTMHDRMEVQAWEQMQKHFGKQYSYVTDMMTGQYFVQSRTCDDMTPTEHAESYDPFIIFTLDLPMGRRQCHLHECLDLFVQPELIQGWKGDLSDQNRMVERRTFLWNMPDILILQLKRFSNRYVKNHCSVNYPLELDLRDYCPRADRTNTRYQLYAVANHTGSLQYGHYYADCKRPDGQWHRFNDAQVAPIELSVLDREAAYVLFYQRASGTVVNETSARTGGTQPPTAVPRAA